MPEKQQTELDISRMLAGYNKDIELILVKISGQKYKTTPLEYMQAHYVDFETIASQKFDGLIVTGAPVEQIPFGNEALTYEIDQFDVELPRDFNTDDAIEWVREKLHKDVEDDDPV
jgi:homoserine O-succinyltransferase